MRLIQADPLETAPPVQGCRITSFRVLGLDALTMKERSGMPYDVVAYEADDLAMQLSESEEGLFHRMLRRAWMNGSIPSDLKLQQDEKSLDSGQPIMDTPPVTTGQTNQFQTRK